MGNYLYFNIQVNIIFANFIAHVINFYLNNRYLNRNYNYWSQRGIKGPKPVIGFGTFIYEVIRDKPLLEREWVRKYGKVYGY